MNMYKLKLTKLQNEIFRFLCIKSGEIINQRTIAKSLKVSAAGIAKAMKGMENLLKVDRSKTMNLISIQIDRNNPRVIALKRIENLKILYDSGFVEFLEEKFVGCSIVLFGSYSLGEDTIASDIDIAVIGSKAKDIDLDKFEKLLERKIVIQYYNKLGEINKNLKENIINGIILRGIIEL